MNNKKLLILNYEFPPLGGGASPVSYELAKGYVKLGHSVDVVTMGFRGLPSYEVKDGIHIYRVPCMRSKKEICHPWEQYSYLRSAKKFLKQHLKTHSYDINHTHFIIPTGVLALWVKKNYGIPYIVTSHGSDVPGFNNDRFKFLHLFTGPFLRNICNEAIAIVSPSRYLLDLINKNIISLGDKGKVISNGIDTAEFKSRVKRKIILSTGRLLPRKGFQYLIQAVSDRDCGYELHIAGNGPMVKKLNNLAKNSRTKVVFHGWLDNKSKKYRELLESAAIYVLASEKENASIALLEAMSAGCAVVTTNISGCPETVGNSGIIVPPRDARSLTRALDSLIVNDKLRRKYQESARKRIISTFDWDKIITKYNSLLVS